MGTVRGWSTSGPPGTVISISVIRSGNATVPMMRLLSMPATSPTGTSRYAACQ
ncbi:hypothetical protein ACFO8R_03930 [Dyella koreensis]|uniref:hypothetical protein n=1 Tax=Dyella koreensis TaxID=311235 RepID=UPI00361B957F